MQPRARSRRVPLAAVVLLASLPLARALAAPPAPDGDAKPPLTRSHSVGYPWRGNLIHGVLLPESGSVRHVGRRREEGHYYGTEEMVALLTDVAARVSARLGGEPLAVGDLSAEHGGPVDGHGSHENGRDADLGFFVRDADGQRVRMDRFVELFASGAGAGQWASLRFDDAANWALVETLLTSDRAAIQYVFVSSALKHRLLREAAREGAPAGVIARAEQVLYQPHAALPHRDHFHVRIYCADVDRPFCLDRAPFWDLRVGVGEH